MLSVQNIDKYYNNELILQDVSFEVQAGEIVGFLGHNGAGKTTTLEIVSGSIAASKGQCFWNGVHWLEDAPLYKSNIGYLPENPPLYGEMKVVDYLFFAAQIQQCSDPLVAIERIVQQLDLHSVLEKSIQYLSKGWQQRIGLAQALIHQPKLLLLDEPSNGLDPRQRYEFHQILRQLRDAGVAILLSSHIVSDIQAIADRILLLNQGILHTLSSEKERVKVKATVESPRAERLLELQQLPNVSNASFYENAPHFILECHESIRSQIAQLLQQDGLLALESAPLWEDEIQKWMIPQYHELP